MSKPNEHQRFEEEEFENDAIGDMIDEFAGTAPAKPEDEDPEEELEQEEEVSAEQEPEGEPDEEPAEGEEEAVSDEEEAEESEDEAEEAEGEEETPAVESEETESEPEVDERDALIRQLQKQNEELLSLIRTPAPETQKDAQVPRLPEQPAAAAGAEQQSIPRKPTVAPPQLTDEMFDSIVSDKAAFEEYLANRDAANAQDIVTAVGMHFRKGMKNYLGIYEFFQSRPELALARPLIEAKAERLQLQDPGLDEIEYYVRAAEELKEALPSSQNTVVKDDGTTLRRQKSAPKKQAVERRLAAPRSRRGAAPVPRKKRKADQSVADQIDEMMKL